MNEVKDYLKRKNIGIVENCKNTSFTYWSTANDPIFVASLAFIRKYI